MPLRAGVSPRRRFCNPATAGGLSVAVAGALAIGACVKWEKSQNPLSPTIAGPLPGVTISAPNTYQPSQNARIQSDQQPVVLMVDNATTNGPRPLSYKFDVAVDGSFNALVFTRDGIAPGGGRTSLRLPDALQSGRSYFWRARAQDGANTGPYSPVGSFLVFTPVVIGKPVAVAPANGVATSNDHPQFVVANAARSGPVGPITYTIDVSSSSSLAPLIAVWQVAEQANQTALNAPSNLPGGTRLFWQVRGSDPSTVGPWSDVQSFKTPDTGPPPPPPGGGGGSCGSRVPVDIVGCHRAQYAARLCPADAPNLLAAIAHDLNSGQTPVYGRLVKLSGNNCGGFACDIICRSDGHIWDVLIDGPDATQGYCGTAIASWTDKGTSGSQCQIIP
jgi:hypothetical protein